MTLRKKTAQVKAAPSKAAARGKGPKKELSTLKTRLSLGPVLFNWAPEVWRDFYFRIADEAPVDVVYVGEVVCSKRAPFFAPYRDAVLARLQKAGKEVVLSSLALVTTPKERALLQDDAAKGLLMEANDVAALTVLAGRPFVVGPFINVLNEGARDFMARQGAVRIVVPSEISQSAVAILAAAPKGPAGGPEGGPEIEMQVFGLQPLAVSMRCYHARAVGRDKDHCRLACAADPQGLMIQSMNGQNLLTVNGTSVLSQGCLVALDEMIALQKQGVGLFRLGALPLDMVAVARLFRAVLDGKESPDSAQESLRACVPNLPFINGFLHTRAGMTWAREAV